MSPDAEALIERARHGGEPTADDAGRVLAAVRATVTAGAALGVGVGASKLTKLGASWGFASWKTGGVVLALVAAGVAAPSRVPAPPPEPLLPSVAARANAIADAVSKTTHVPELPVLAGDVRASWGPSRPAAPEPGLRVELELLERVQGELARSDGRAALVLLDGHRTRDRQLLSERQAARVLALCAAGRTGEARALAEEFLQRHPTSLQRTAVDRSCAGGEHSSEAR